MSSAPAYYDRVQNSSTTTGTGAYTLGAAISGFQDWSIVGDGKSAYYCAFEVDVNGNPSGGWEVGLGTYTAAGTSLSRDTVLASSNSNSAVSWAAGTRRIILTMPASDAPRKVVADVYTTTGANTWTKRTGAVSVLAQLVSGGGGGGAGRRGAAGTNRCSGQGGQNGAVVEAVFQAAQLGATETVTVGAGGTGGTAQTVDDTNGATANNGGDTSFGAWATAIGGRAGAGGTSATLIQNWATFNENFPMRPQPSSAGQRGSNSTSPTTPASRPYGGPAPGGDGGGLNTSNTLGLGTAGDASGFKVTTGSGIQSVSGQALNTGGTAGGTDGASGGAGTSAPTGYFGFGAGGGGGAASVAGVAGSGNNGGKYGGGGGGGGASVDGQNSGAGGNGGDGIAVVITFF